MSSAKTRGPKELLSECQALMTKAKWNEALKVCDAILKDFSKEPSARSLVARTHFLRAQCRVYLVELDKALLDCDKALELAREVMDRSVEGETLRLMGNILWKKADYKKAHERLEKALEIARSLKDIRLEGLVHLEMGTTTSNTRDLDSAEREYREAVLALERAGDARELARAYNNFANNFMYQKKWDKAAEMFSKCKKKAEKIHDENLIAWGAFNRAECLVELDNTKEAFEELAVAIPLLEKNKDLYGLVGATQILGLTHAKVGDYKKAEELLERSRKMAHANKMPVSEALIVRDIGRMHKWKGDRQKAIQFLNEAKSIFEKHGATRDAQRVVEEIRGLG